MSIPVGTSTDHAIAQGQSYRILQINGQDPSNFNTITIDSNTGVISTTSSTVPGDYGILIYNDGYHESILFSFVGLTVTKPTVQKMYMPLFTDNARVFYKPHTLSGVGSVKNYRIKSYKT